MLTSVLAFRVLKSRYISENERCKEPRQVARKVTFHYYRVGLGKDPSADRRSGEAVVQGEGSG